MQIGQSMPKSVPARSYVQELGSLDEAAAGSVPYFACMDLSKILAELQKERTRIEEAIVALERLRLGHGNRRGRPPAYMAALKDTPVKRRGRSPGGRNKPKAEAIEIQSRPNRKNFAISFQIGLSENL
jgi:hypothetical protein